MRVGFKLHLFIFYFNNFILNAMYVHLQVVDLQEGMPVPYLMAAVG